MANRKESIDFWRVQVESAIYSLSQVAGDLNPNIRRKVISKKAETALRCLRPIIPYCLHPAGNDGSMILVNRDYKPLGNTVPEWVDYALYHWAHVPPPPADLLFKDGRIYFFIDQSAPWRSKGALEGLIDRLKNLLSVDWTLKREGDDCAVIDGKESFERKGNGVTLDVRYSRREYRTCENLTLKA